MPVDAAKPGHARRSLIVPTIISLAIIGVLLSLGFWQLQRKQQKVALVAALHERLAAPPSRIPPTTWVHLTPERDEFRRVIFNAKVDTATQAQVYSSGSALRKDIARSGVWVFAPATLADGSVVVVNRGFVPEGQPVPAGGENGEQSLAGYIRFPEQASWLTPPADMAKRLWFLRDHHAMAQALGWAKGASVAPYYIDLESPVPESGVPKPGPLTVNLKDNHLQYAITWFLLALAVSVAFLVWLWQQRKSPP